MDPLPWVIGHNMKMLQQELADAYATVENHKDAIRLWEKEVENLKLRIKILEADLAGVQAQRDALKKLHPNSPLLQPSGKRYTDPSKNNAEKSHLILEWERTFDLKLSGQNLWPRSYRLD